MNNHSEDVGLWLKLSNASGVGAVMFRRLLDKFETIENIFGASVSQLTKVEGIGNKTAEAICRTRNSFDADKELELAERAGVWIVTAEDDRYPVLLKKVNDGPAVLYVKGTLERGDSLAVSIVGSRRCSLYGSEQASRFGYILGQSGFTIVSGMAKGIDTAAHKGALSGGGRTIAVQGCGLNKIFPAENEALFEEIAASGACVSSYPLNYEPLAENFPSRNRIIAGSGLAVVVIEAGNRSGALITARLGLDYNREVMAVPGKIDSPLSVGSNKLIKEGAKLIDCPGDIIEALGLVGQTVKEVVSKTENQIEKEENVARAEAAKIRLSDYEKKIYANISNEATHIEDIIADTGLEIGRINTGLISLRLKGLINHLQGNIYNKR